MKINTESARAMRVVGSIILAVALLGIPLSVQAAPIQGDDVVTGADAGPMGWLASLTQLWDQVKAVFGAGSAVGSAPDEGGTTTTALVPLGPDSTQMSTTDTPLSSEAQAKPSLDPVGSK